MFTLSVHLIYSQSLPSHSAPVCLPLSWEVEGSSLWVEIIGRCCAGNEAEDWILSLMSSGGGVGGGWLALMVMGARVFNKRFIFHQLITTQEYTLFIKQRLAFFISTFSGRFISPCQCTHCIIYVLQFYWTTDDSIKCFFVVSWSFLHHLSAHPQFVQGLRIIKEKFPFTYFVKYFPIFIWKIEIYEDSLIRKELAVGLGTHGESLPVDCWWRHHWAELNGWTFNKGLSADENWFISFQVSTRFTLIQSNHSQLFH